MAGEKKCPECGTVFGCCMNSDQSIAEKCWCDELPNVIPLTEGAECLCPECLKKKIKISLNNQ